MEEHSKSILLLGESDVGKTHFGAQLLRRLNLSEGELRMSGAPTSIEAFEVALEKLSQGLAADHTPRPFYADSVWPVKDTSGADATLVWPDYGGEQISEIVENKRLHTSWRRRVIESSGWLLMVRPDRAAVADDVLTRSAAMPASTNEATASLSAQSRLVELLQMLLFVCASTNGHAKNNVPVAILLSCYDELQFDGSPRDYLAAKLPLLDQFIRSRWPERILKVFGLSALGRPLSPETPDPEFAAKGPEKFGYVVRADGSRSSDLSVPVRALMGSSVG